MNRRIKVVQSRKRPVRSTNDSTDNEQHMRKFFQPVCAKVMVDLIDPKVDTQVVYKECSDTPILCLAVSALSKLADEKPTTPSENITEEYNREAIDKATERVRQMSMEVNNKKVVSLSPVSGVVAEDVKVIEMKLYVCHYCKLNIEENQKRIAVRCERKCNLQYHEKCVHREYCPNCFSRIKSVWTYTKCYDRLTESEWTRSTEKIERDTYVHQAYETIIMRGVDSDRINTSSENTSQLSGWKDASSPGYEDLVKVPAEKKNRVDGERNNQGRKRKDNIIMSGSVITTDSFRLPARKNRKVKPHKIGTNNSLLEKLDEGIVDDNSQGPKSPRIELCSTQSRVGVRSEESEPAMVVKSEDLKVSLLPPLPQTPCEPPLILTYGDEK